MLTLNKTEDCYIKPPTGVWACARSKPKASKRVLCSLVHRYFLNSLWCVLLYLLAIVALYVISAEVAKKLFYQKVQLQP